MTTDKMAVINLQRGHKGTSEDDMHGDARTAFRYMALNDVRKDPCVEEFRRPSRPSTLRSHTGTNVIAWLIYGRPVEDHVALLYPCHLPPNPTLQPPPCLP